MDDKTEGVAKLAIRIYSVIANSGATERNFSDFGNIQTKLRNRLSIEKTHKTNIVRMDIARDHASRGLTTSRGKRKLGHNDEPINTVETVNQSATGAPEPELEDTSFTAIARHLIDDADDADLPEPNDNERDPPMPPLPPISTLQAPAAVQRRSRRPVRTCIDLKDVFDFTMSNSGLDFYWKGGELNLEKERVSIEQEHVDELGFDVSQSQALPLGSTANSSNLNASSSYST
jgi:hypothetical protein